MPSRRHAPRPPSPDRPPRDPTICATRLHRPFPRWRPPRFSRRRSTSRLPALTVSGRIGPPERKKRANHETCHHRGAPVGRDDCPPRLPNSGRRTNRRRVRGSDAARTGRSLAGDRRPTPTNYSDHAERNGRPTPTRRSRGRTGPGRRPADAGGDFASGQRPGRVGRRRYPDWAAGAVEAVTGRERPDPPDRHFDGRAALCRRVERAGRLALHPAGRRPRPEAARLHPGAGGNLAERRGRSLLHRGGASAHLGQSQQRRNHLRDRRSLSHVVGFALRPATRSRPHAHRVRHPQPATSPLVGLDRPAGRALAHVRRRRAAPNRIARLLDRAHALVFGVPLRRAERHRRHHGQLSGRRTRARPRGRRPRR